MVVRLKELYPEIKFEYVITPTGDELPEMIDHWKMVAELLDTPLTVVSSGESLQGLITRQKALPNHLMRWCTRILKIEPFNAYLLRNIPAIAYVGLRADEEARVGNTIYGSVDGIEQRFPLREWGWGISEVWQYLDDRGIIIPERTDCGRCFFQRLPEWWNLWQYHPDVYTDAEQNEALTKHTFRHKDRDTWPADLKGLREQFDKGRIPKGAGQLSLFEGRTVMCRTCTL